MAKSTKNTYLMYKTGEATNYTKLIDIIDYPDLQEAKNEVDATTLSDDVKKYVEGIRENSQKEFNANYNATDYDKLIALENTETDFALYFDSDNPSAEPLGDYGKFGFSGFLTVSIVGGTVDEVIKMKITITMASAVTKID